MEYFKIPKWFVHVLRAYPSEECKRIILTMGYAAFYDEEPEFKESDDQYMKEFLSFCARQARESKGEDTCN